MRAGAQSHLLKIVVHPEGLSSHWALGTWALLVALLLVTEEPVTICLLFEGYIFLMYLNVHLLRGKKEKNKIKQRRAVGTPVKPTTTT